MWPAHPVWCWRARTRRARPQCRTFQDARALRQGGSCRRRLPACLRPELVPAAASPGVEAAWCWARRSRSAHLAAARTASTPQAAKEEGKARVKSAYQLWSDSERDNIKKEDSSLKMTDIAKVLGERWKALGEDEKAVRVGARV